MLKTGYGNPGHAPTVCLCRSVQV